MNDRVRQSCLKLPVMRGRARDLRLRFWRCGNHWSFSREGVARWPCLNRYVPGNMMRERGRILRR